MIRGDRLAPGYLSPFHQKLRAALIGVLAPGFIKAKAPYALNHYYPYKDRLVNSDQITHPKGKKGEKPWKDTSKGHRDAAAKRKMIKAFLTDLYVAWREVEGLPVREPYAVEYLGKVHGGAENVIVAKKTKKAVRKLKMAA